MSFDRWHRVAGGVLLGLLPLLCGCYEFDRPLGPPEKGTIDRALVGTWRCRSEAGKDELGKKDAKEEKESVFKFLPFDATQYILDVGFDEDGTPKNALYRLYSSRVGAHVLLNAQEVKPQPQNWSLVRYRIEASKVTFWLIDDKKVGDSGEAGLRTVRQRIADESIYEKFFTCTREEGNK